MNIQAEKIEIMKLILETDNPIILESVKNIFKKNTTTDFWETLPQLVIVRLNGVEPSRDLLLRR